MSKISFYQVMNGDIIKSACIILEKCFKNHLKTFVQVDNEDTRDLINKTLWTFAQKSFIPHGSDIDPMPERQPIYISHLDECPIDATCLMLINKTRIDLGGYERVIIIIDGAENNNIKNASILSAELKNLGHNVEYHKQTKSGTWESVTI